MDRPRHAKSELLYKYTYWPLLHFTNYYSVCIRKLYCAYPHSNHDIILLTLDLDRQPRGPGYWHFNNTLLDDGIFNTEIREFWSQWLTEQPNFPSLLQWWESAKQNFKRIAIKRSVTLRKLEWAEYNRLSRDLDRLKTTASTGNPAATEQFLLAKKQLNDLEQQSLEAVKIRVRAGFMEEGEKTSRYFYSLDKRRQADQTIKTLTKDNLDTISSTRDILFETHAFYKSLYTADNIDPQVQRTFFDTPIPRLPDTDQQSYEDLLSDSELESTLKKMENNKSPGIDGLTSNFYKHFWPTIGQELTRVFNYCFHHGTLTLAQRRDVITLIFKKGDRTRLKNWRPITLLTTDYKILTKALATRLTKSYRRL